MTDRKHTCARPLVDVVRAALDGGLRAVQLREKDLEGRELTTLATRLRRLTTEYHARLIVNDRLDIALAVEADGVHLGQDSFPVDTARQIVGPDTLIGVSTHSEAEICASSGANFVLFGPVYETRSKAAYGAPRGLERLRRAAALSPVPVFAIGGIRTDRVSEVVATGAHGVAVISAISAAPDPRSATVDLLNEVEKARPDSPAG